MTYGHAERNLAFIRQLEAETRQLTARSAFGRVPLSDKQLQGDGEIASTMPQTGRDTMLDTSAKTGTASGLSTPTASSRSAALCRS
jgi:hypothetical protein